MFSEVQVGDTLYAVAKYTRYSHYEVVKVKVRTVRPDGEGLRIAVAGKWHNGDDYSVSLTTNKRLLRIFFTLDEAGDKCIQLNNKASKRGQ